MSPDKHVQAAREALREIQEDRGASTDEKLDAIEEIEKSASRAFLDVEAELADDVR